VTQRLAQEGTPGGPELGEPRINVDVGPLRDWPVAVFIGAIPAIKLLQRGDLPKQVRFAVQLFEGAAKPVGGDGEGTVELVRTPPALKKAANTVAKRG
jgi:hypothetical protein